jgi:hypothetical protein
MVDDRWSNRGCSHLHLNDLHVFKLFESEQSSKQASKFWIGHMLFED